MIRYWVARDKNGKVWIYNKKPHKDYKTNKWTPSSDPDKIGEGNWSGYTIENKRTSCSSKFDDVKWEDEEPKVILICW